MLAIQALGDGNFSGWWRRDHETIWTSLLVNKGVYSPKL